MDTLRNDHIVLTADVEGKPVRVMVDSGASASYASPRVRQQLKDRVRTKVKPYPLNMADGSPTDYGGGWIREELHGIRLRIGHHEERINLDIVSIKYDILLGMDWLRRHNPVIDWKARTLKFPDCSRENRTGDRSPPTVPFVKAI